jgi:hypothetical protein
MRVRVGGGGASVTFVTNETPVDLGGGSFTTASTYIPGSLVVHVDALDETPAVTEVPGGFTMAFTPRSWETVRVSYRTA